MSTEAAGAARSGEAGVLVVVEVQAIHDAEALTAYQQGARAQLGRYGGTVLARGGQAIEGSPPFERLLIQRWPSAEAFLRWQDSEDYRPLLARRRRCAEMRIAVVPLVG